MAIQIGDFFFDKNFQFQDGVIGEKLFIALARSVAGNFVVARTTSNPQRKSFDAGCHNDAADPHFFIPKNENSPFNEHTWVMLDYLSEFDCKDLETAVNRKNTIIRLGVLPNVILQGLMDCASRAEDTHQDQYEAIRNCLAELPQLV